MMNATITIPSRLPWEGAVPADEQAARPRPGIPLGGAIVYASSLMFIAALAIGARQRGFDFGYFSSDPNHIAGAPFYAGALSNMGVLLWWAAATAALLAGAVLRTVPASPIAPLLMTAAGLSAVLAIDDIYMVHEVVAPEYLGVPQIVVLAVYALGAAVWALGFRRLLVARGPWMLGCALGFFAVSILLDQLNLANLLWEDGAKFVGVAGWCAWLCRHAYVETAAAVRQTVGMRHRLVDTQVDSLLTVM